MKSIIYGSLIILCFISRVTAQTEIQWEAYIYVEDAKGNKDSISMASVLGLGPGYHHPELGETEWPMVLDSVLDIRTVIQEYPSDCLSDDRPYILSKRRVFGTKKRNERDSCYNNRLGAFNIGIYARYQPLKIYWNATDWNSDCQSNYFISGDPYNIKYSLLVFSFDSIVYGCFKEKDHLIWKFPLSEDLNVSLLQDMDYLSILPTQDGRNDTMWLATFIPASLSPCGGWVSTDDLHLSNIQLYPNPAMEIITIKTDVPVKSIKIYNLDGRVELFEPNTLGQDEIDISSISSGMKIIEINFQNNQKAYKKWVKL